MITARPDVSGTKEPVMEANNGTELTLTFYPPDSAERLQKFHRDRRNIGIPISGSAVPNSGRDTRTWLALPTLRLPLRADSWGGAGNNDLNVTVAPVQQTVLDSLGLTLMRTVMELDEVHLIQAARIYRSLPPDPRPNELRRVTFGADYTTTGGVYEETLTRNVVGLQFAYNPSTRLLTMYIAERGFERNATGAGQPGIWPSWLPALSAADTQYRIVTKVLTWRVRN
jgi:hypothetical protein